ncbi:MULTISPECIES: hypothetical protein [Pectobacterium]|uniref:Uncharacterized protein n=1 Tax=Pectobacterium versatile TaxID=2488639 RepID=A0A855MMH8_9GAMM|nr:MULTISPECIES: hypothetical protein [Pectobacterium]AVT57936.1 hypothetical protein OA04_13240 [Pectobacterium versatile]MBA0158339.1 hypothetical protein [Pectobacterium versatile]MBA0171403.1 hypothetical protein [Pectobacterium versatile]MBB1529019.1 hypothetical protein [Pectobacterium carotovorum subsp. carotovorum]MBD0846266.1 hypothetical protein [Pectobacterium carotovorum subsp. carotovorum]
MLSLKKYLKWLLIALVLYTIGVFSLESWLDKRISDNPAYEKSDMVVYRYFTDTDIAGVPKISERYYFEYHIGDGYAPMNEIIFSDASDLAPLRDYLKKLGYEKEIKRFGDSEVWKKPAGKSDTFYLWHIKDRNEVRLSKVFTHIF